MMILASESYTKYDHLKRRPDATEETDAFR